MVSREAAVNAVLHGNGLHSGKEVRVNLEQTRDTLTISIADEGSGFDPDAVPDPLAPENLLRSSGRGIFLMRAYMDEVHFRQLNPGQEIVLVKRRQEPAHKESTMSLKFKPRQVDGVSIMDLSGRVTLGEGSVTLRDAVRDVLSKGSNKILLNLGDVDYIDSSGLGELVSAYTAVKTSGGEMKLLSLTKKVKDLLQITKLYTVFDVMDDEAAAVASFQ